MVITHPEHATREVKVLHPAKIRFSSTHDPRVLRFFNTYLIKANKPRDMVMVEREKGDQRIYEISFEL